MNVSITVDPVSETTVMLNLRGYKRGAEHAITNGIREATSYLRSYIETRMLSGQVLKVRTGTLHRSLTHRVVTERGGEVGIVSVGKEAWYGKLHEFGFNKQFSASTVSRFGLSSAFMGSGAGWMISATGVMSAKLFQVASIAAGLRGVQLGAHRAMALRFKWRGKWIMVRSVHHPGLKQRSFMARGLTEATPRIKRIIETRLRQELAAARKGPQ